MMDIRQRSQVKQIFLSPPFDNFLQGWTEDFPLSNYFGQGFEIYPGIEARTSFITSSDARRNNGDLIISLTATEITYDFYIYFESSHTIERIRYIRDNRSYRTRTLPTSSADVNIRYNGTTSFEPNKLYKISFLRNGTLREVYTTEIPIVKTSFLRERRFFETYKSDTQTLKYALQMDKGYNVFNPLAGVGADRHIHSKDIEALANDIRNEIDVSGRERARLDRFNLEMNEGNLNIDIDGNYI